MADPLYEIPDTAIVMDFGTCARVILDRDETGEAFEGVVLEMSGPRARAEGTAVSVIVMTPGAAENLAAALRDIVEVSA